MSDRRSGEIFGLAGGLIGATGFEPATFRPPAGCATRELRCRGVPPRHVQACGVQLSFAELRADWALEWALGRSERRRIALHGMHNDQRALDERETRARADFS
jgi:hypothetical protein